MIFAEKSRKSSVTDIFIILSTVYIQEESTLTV